MNYNFDENEMPYGILERFGLTQEMIEDLPTDIIQNIFNGRLSPVLPVHITADDGEEVKARTRFSLVRMPEGNVDILFFPKLDEYDFKVFNEQQKQNLLTDRYHLTGAEMQKLQNGEILSIIEDDDEISIGIDLNSNTGIRLAAGNEQVWRREAKREWDKYNFGIFGCWTMDENGNLDYIHEEDYSEEIWNEQKKQGMRMMQR